MRYALAIDIGASSGRHMLGWKENGHWNMEEVYRFPNAFRQQNGHDCWDVEALLQHILEGMKQCKMKGTIPATVAIDTWGVDYVLLDQNRQRLGNAVAYRDNRTQGMDRLLESRLSFKQHYAYTGIAKQPYNTVYQLMADFLEHPEYNQKASQLVFMPCYLTGLLCGKMENEYTIASTSGLLNAETKDWDETVIRAAGIPPAILAKKPVPPGTSLGYLSPEIAEKVGYNCQVVLTACHDTGSAFFAVPAKDQNAVYLSSGTWSLLGTMLPKPVLSTEALEAGFTNEGGVNGIRFLQNIMGLWMLQRIRSEWKERLSFAEMASLAEQGTNYLPIVDATSQRFLNPDSMIGAVQEELTQSGQPLPQNDAQLLFCVNHSLAVCYARAVQKLQQLTGRCFTSLNIVGGGCNNQLLNRLTQEATGLPVTIGPSEATALGNLMVQMKG